MMNERKTTYNALNISGLIKLPKYCSSNSLIWAKGIYKT